ncbi:hypothetical protein VF21_06162 [Pseudogymnoascus sp. 05NY08]|nr:hypothetical protein VF21_06162 [Pseudogymnoascus sp. 05NY08]
MVHRDIKPENILYDNGRQHGSMTFYISDFGLTVPKQLVGGGAGTISFMAPETTRIGQCDSASDVYSFGVTLLEVIGKYCIEESMFRVEKWRTKLRAFGVKDYAKYRDTEFPGAQLPRTQNPVITILSTPMSDTSQRRLHPSLEEKPRPNLNWRWHPGGKERQHPSLEEKPRPNLHGSPGRIERRHPSLDESPHPVRDGRWRHSLILKTITFGL